MTAGLSSGGHGGVHALLGGSWSPEATGYAERTDPIVEPFVHMAVVSPRCECGRLVVGVAALLGCRRVLAGPALSRRSPSTCVTLFAAEGGGEKASVPSILVVSPAVCRESKGGHEKQLSLATRTRCFTPGWRGLRGCLAGRTAAAMPHHEYFLFPGCPPLSTSLLFLPPPPSTLPLPLIVLTGCHHMLARRTESNPTLPRGEKTRAEVDEEVVASGILGLPGLLRHGRPLGGV